MRRPKVPSRNSPGRSPATRSTTISGVNCVAPGVIRTRFHADMTAERMELNPKQRIPLHREGTPEQVAEVVALLITNDYVTGETIVIDGGLTSRIA